MVNSRLCETTKLWFKNSRPRLKAFYQIRDRDLILKKSQPKTLSAEDFEVMVPMKFLAIACIKLMVKNKWPEWQWIIRLPFIMCHNFVSYLLLLTVYISVTVFHGI